VSFFLEPDQRLGDAQLLLESLVLALQLLDDPILLVDRHLRTRPAIGQALQATLLLLGPPAGELRGVDALALQQTACYRACLLMPEGRISRRLIDGDCPSASEIALTEADWAVSVSMM